jgi:hypothetical protein
MTFCKLLRRVLDIAVCFLGCLSPLYLLVVWATAHDIFKDYVSTDYNRYNADLPGWYNGNVHSCHGEWKALSIAFILIVIFHILLFARFVVSRFGSSETKALQTP